MFDFIIASINRYKVLNADNVWEVRRYRIDANTEVELNMYKSLDVLVLITIRIAAVTMYVYSDRPECICISDHGKTREILITDVTVKRYQSLFNLVNQYLVKYITEELQLIIKRSKEEHCKGK